MLLKFFLLAVTGKILLYAIQIFPLTIKITEKNKYFDKLITCDFCLGCWVYFGLNIYFGVWFEGIESMFLLSPFLMGILTSFLVHLVSLGWKTKFEVIIIE